MDPDCLALNPSSSVYHEFQLDYCSITTLPPAPPPQIGGLKQVRFITHESGSDGWFQSSELDLAHFIWGRSYIFGHVAGWW